MINSMVMDLLFGVMERNMRGNSKKTVYMVLAFIMGKTVTFLKVTMKMTWKMVLEKKCLLQMILSRGFHMRATLKMGFHLVMEL